MGLLFALWAFYVLGITHVVGDLVPFPALFGWAGIVGSEDRINCAVNPSARPSTIIDDPDSVVVRAVDLACRGDVTGSRALFRSLLLRGGSPQPNRTQWQQPEGLRGTNASHVAQASFALSSFELLAGMWTSMCNTQTCCDRERAA